VKRCGLHPGYAADDCLICERLFEEEFEDNGAGWPDGMEQPDQERYERWLGEIAP
jgi:hypothetical protein